MFLNELMPRNKKTFFQTNFYWFLQIWNFTMRSACCKHGIVIQTELWVCHYEWGAEESSWFTIVVIEPRNFNAINLQTLGLYFAYWLTFQTFALVMENSGKLPLKWYHLRVAFISWIITMISFLKATCL